MDYAHELDFDTKKIDKHVPARFVDALSITPPEWKTLIAQYFVLGEKHNTLTDTKWKAAYPSFYSSSESIFSNPNAPTEFEKNPQDFLIATHNTLLDFPGALNRVLKLISLHKRTPLSKNEFIVILDKLQFEAESRNWLTPALKQLFHALILYPLDSPKELANKLDTNVKVIRRRLNRFRNRFFLNRVMQPDYYKFGLSRVYLFNLFKNRSNLFPSYPVTTRYFETEIPLRTGLHPHTFSIQTYCPPKTQWHSLKKWCEENFNLKEIEWLGGAPMLFFAEELFILYNTDSYNVSQRKWNVNEDYLEICLSTGLWEDWPIVDVSPALHFVYDVNTSRFDFDLLDLKIIQYFWDLEEINRFATVRRVAKAIGVSYRSIKTRLQRMLEKRMVIPYYHTAFILPRTVHLIMLSENPSICDKYLSMTTIFPCSYTVKLRSYPAKYFGIWSIIYLPSGSRVSYILQDFLFSNQEISTGFCVESQVKPIPKRKLWHFWDPIRKRWKWNDLPWISNSPHSTDQLSPS